MRFLWSNNDKELKRTQSTDINLTKSPTGTACFLNPLTFEERDTTLTWALRRLYTKV